LWIQTKRTEGFLVLDVDIVIVELVDKEVEECVVKGKV